jgi:hypothetical protein
MKNTKTIRVENDTAEYNLLTANVGHPGVAKTIIEGIVIESRSTYYCKLTRKP